MILKLFGSRKVKLPAASRRPTPALAAPEDEVRSSALKIVHAGGRVENYYMAVPATRILDKYPSFILARPDVFRRPWEAVVRPDEILIPGQKFYLVPRCTLKKLRRRIQKPGGESSTNSFSFVPQQQPSRRQKPGGESSTNSSSSVAGQPPSKKSPADDGISSKSFSQQISDDNFCSADESNTTGRIRTPNRQVRFTGIDHTTEGDSDSIFREKKGYAENRVKRNPDPQPGGGKRRVRNTPTWEPSLKSITEGHGSSE